MAENHTKDAADNRIDKGRQADSSELNPARQVGATAVSEAESKRTNASDGSMNKLDKIAAQEASIEINFGDTTVSRRNALTEKQASESSDAQLLTHGANKGHDKPPTGATRIASHAEDLHKHHSNEFHNHGNVYTCAMLVNRALAEAGYKLSYGKGENHNIVHNLDHSLAHNKHFGKVPTHPYEPKVGDVVIFGDHHSGIITAIGPEGPILTYGGSTQTQKTASTPLNILEKNPIYAGAPTHVYRCKDTH